MQHSITVHDNPKTIGLREGDLTLPVNHKLGASRRGFRRLLAPVVGSTRTPLCTLRSLKP